MQYHIFYRLTAGFDFILSLLTATLWLFAYRRTQSLITLQFSKFGLDGSNTTQMLEHIEEFKVLIRSVGSNHNDNMSAAILGDIYHQVHDSCGAYYKKARVPSPQKNAKKLKMVNLHITNICIIVIISCLGVSLLSNTLALLTTLHRRAGRAWSVGLVLFLHSLSYLGYTASALEFVIDPRLTCSTDRELRQPLTVLVVATAGILKPAQLYVVLKYLRRVLNGVYAVKKSSDDTYADLRDDEEPQMDPSISVIILPKEEERQCWPHDPLTSEEEKSEDEEVVKSKVVKRKKTIK